MCVCVVYVCVRELMDIYLSGSMGWGEGGMGTYLPT